MGKETETELAFDHKEVRYETELVFEHALDAAEDGRQISGLEIAENRWQREQGQHLPADLGSDDYSIQYRLRDAMIDPGEQAWEAAHDAVWQRLIAGTSGKDHRRLLLDHLGSLTCVGDDSNYIEPEPGPAYTVPKPATGFAVASLGRRKRVP